MRVGLLAEELYRRDSPCYLGGVTPQRWDELKGELEALHIEYLCIELRPVDGGVEFLVLASAPFRCGDVPPVAKTMALGTSSKKVSGHESCGWMIGIASTADSLRYRAIASGAWGSLVVHDDKEVKSA